MQCDMSSEVMDCDRVAMVTSLMCLDMQRQHINLTAPNPNAHLLAMSLNIAYLFTFRNVNQMYSMYLYTLFKHVPLL